MSKEYSVVATATDIAALEGNKAIIAGEVVFATLQEDAVSTVGFLPQDSRAITTGLLDQYKKDAPKLRVAIDPALAQAKGKRFAFAIDAYLAWGRRNKSKNPVVLFGGAHTQTGIAVDVLVFEDGNLIAYREKSLPALEAYSFRNSVLSLMEEFDVEYPGVAFYQAEPLTQWDIERINWVGREALKGLRYKRITTESVVRNQYLVPAVIAIAGVAIYGAAISVGWQKLQVAGEAYEIAIDNPEIRKQGGINTEYLDLMNARRLYMESGRKQDVMAKKAAEIAAGVTVVKNVRIMEMHLPAPNLGGGLQVGLNAPGANGLDANGSLTAGVQGRDPDVLLVLSAPKGAETGLDQANAIMAQIAQQTGLSLRLAMAGSRDLEQNRIFNIEGFIHE